MPFTKTKTSLCLFLKEFRYIFKIAYYLKFHPSYKRKSTVEKRFCDGGPLVDLDSGLNTFKRLLRIHWYSVQI